MLQNEIRYKIIYIILEFKFEISFNMISNEMEWEKKHTKQNKASKLKEIKKFEEQRSEERETNF